MSDKKKAAPKKDFLDVLRKPTQVQPVESKPLDEPREALPAAPEPPRQEFTGFSARISIENDLMLQRVKFWVPGAVKQDIFNVAMRKHLLSMPESQKPLPDEAGPTE